MRLLVTLVCLRSSGFTLVIVAESCQEMDVVENYCDPSERAN